MIMESLFYILNIIWLWGLNFNTYNIHTFALAWKLIVYVSILMLTNIIKVTFNKYVSYMGRHLYLYNPLRKDFVDFVCCEMHCLEMITYVLETLWLAYTYYTKILWMSFSQNVLVHFLKVYKFINQFIWGI